MTSETPGRQKQSKRTLSSPLYESDTKRASYAQAVMSSSPPPSSLPPEGVDSTAPVSSLTIPEDAMDKIADLLVETFKGQIESLVEKIATGVIDKLNDKIKSLETVNSNLVRENVELRRKITYLEDKLDDQEQYSRRNLLRVSGICETKGENTDELILKVCEAVGADLTLSEIDRSHRVGRPKRPKPDQPAKPRDIIVKFTSYRSRQKLFLKRSSMKTSGYANSYINEDLTRKRSFLLFKARELVRSKHLIGAWSMDGNIVVKDNDSKLSRLFDLSDLDPFLLLAPGQQRRTPVMRRIAK